MLATVPSVTAISRTSLLTGSAQDRRPGRGDASASPHSGAGASPCSSTRPTSPPSPAVPSPGRSATQIAKADTVVGVVLNTIDDALDKGKLGPAHWTVDEVTYLRQVLDEARRAGRPVILTADHGHVLG